MNLVVIVPTRERPDKAATLVEAFNATCTADTSIVLAVDDNDPTLPQYLALNSDRVSVVVGVVSEPKTMVHALNQACIGVIKQLNPYAVGFMGDDHAPRTVGWDSRYLQALGDLGTGIVYGNDLLQGQALPTQAAMTADIVHALGYMAPTTLRHMYVDNFWRDLGSLAGCLRYLPDVIVEHLHPLAGKAEQDDGYQRVNAPSVYAADQAAYNAYVASQLERDADTVRALRPDDRHEWRLFDEGTIPEYTKPDWYAGREHAPHLEQAGHRDRLMATATMVAKSAYASGFTNVVDLGAGDGGLLSLLGPNLTAWGYDLQASNLEAAKQRGVDVRYGNVTDDDIEWADIAVCTEMLEHLVDPHGFVRRIAEHCPILVCSSPRNERPGSAYEFHTWAWDMDGYRNLVEQAGYVVKHHQRVHGFQVLLAVKRQ